MTSGGFPLTDIDILYLPVHTNAPCNMQSISLVGENRDEEDDNDYTKDVGDNFVNFVIGLEPI